MELRGTQTQLQLKLQMCWRVPLPHLIEFTFFLQSLDTCINKIDVQTPATMKVKKCTSATQYLNFHTA